MVKAIDRKVLRDLAQLKGQVVTVALVVACGIAGYVAFQSTWDSLEAVVDVLTTDAVNIRPGAFVQLERWGGDSALSGHVHRVEPSAFTKLSALGVEEQRVNVVIHLDEPRSRWTDLGDGFRVEASILTSEGRNRLLVPGGAVFRQGDRWAVYVVEAGRVRPQTIDIGRRNDSDVEVLRGLRQGERVVLYPTDNVDAGVRVSER